MKNHRSVNGKIEDSFRESVSKRLYQDTKETKTYDGFFKMLDAEQVAKRNKKKNGWRRYQHDKDMPPFVTAMGAFHIYGSHNNNNSSTDEESSPVPSAPADVSISGGDAVAGGDAGGACGGDGGAA